MPPTPSTQLHATTRRKINRTSENEQIRVHTPHNMQKSVADILEHYDAGCISITKSNINALRSGVYPKSKFEELVRIMKTHGCGMALSGSRNPSMSVSLQKLSKEHYFVYPIDRDNDNVFKAVLQGLHFVSHHKPFRVIPKKTIKDLRRHVVETVLGNPGLANNVLKTSLGGYLKQFANGLDDSPLVKYQKKMQENAFGSYAELDAMAKLTHAEIHIYTEHQRSYVFQKRVQQSHINQRKRRFIIRLLQSGDGKYFSLLLSKPFFEHQYHGFWKGVNTVALGRKGTLRDGNLEKAVELFQASKNNNKRGKNLPNASPQRSQNTNSFNWNESPKL